MNLTWKCGHPRTLENTRRWRDPRHLSGYHETCRACRDAAMPQYRRRYAATEKGRMCQQRYNRSEKGRARVEQYRATIKGIFAYERSLLNKNMRRHAAQLIQLQEALSQVRQIAVSR